MLWPASCTIAGEAVRTLDDDRPRAVSEQRLKHLGEARAVADGIRAADRRVVELADDLETRR
jgi:hypothetical protein